MHAVVHPIQQRVHYHMQQHGYQTTLEDSMGSITERHAEAGRKAAQAYMDGDHNRQKSWSTHHHSALLLLTGSDRDAASAAYHEAYRDARGYGRTA